MPGITSATNQNCLFHCFAHVLFSQGDPHIQQTPGYRALITATKDYYQIDDEFDESDIDDINEEFTSPLERELIWGPVFRQLMISEMSKAIPQNAVAIQRLKIGQEVYVEDFAPIAALFGANVTVTNEYDTNEDSWETENSLFNFNLVHKSVGGGHYEFYFGDREDTELEVAHNQAIGEPDSETRLYDYSQTALAEAYAIADDAKARANKIKEIVNARLQDLWYGSSSSASTSYSSSTSASVDDAVAPATGLEFVDDVEVNEADDHIELICRTQRAEDPDVVSLDGFSSQSEDAEKVRKIAFERAFIQRLQEIFPVDENWDLDLEEEAEGKITASCDGRSIYIDATAEGTIFSGSAQDVDKILEAAMAYEDTLEDNEILEYELSAGDEEVAVDFLAKLSASGVDIRKVTDIKIAGQYYNDKEWKELLQKANPDIKFEEENKQSARRGLKK